MTQKLYDRADIYDLIESDLRTQSIRSDWAECLLGLNIATLLDVSIGTGGMTLPLQELGIEVCGSDLSDNMLERCRQKALAKGKPIELRCSDFRDLTCWQGRQFDCVACTGNAIGHVNNADVQTTLRGMDALVKPGGYLYLDSRNWERIQADRQRFYLYNPFFHDGNRVNLVQVWDHNADGTITFNLLYSFERDNRIFQKEVFEEHYYPFPMSLATDTLRRLGYTCITWKPLPLEIAETDFAHVPWYRIIAHKPCA